MLASLSFAALLALAFAIASFAGPVGDQSGFEDDDGDLAVDSTFDWNGFAPTTWTGTAPYRESDKVVSGWTFKGIEDDQVSNTDTAFAGGVKQDDNCPALKGGKAPNKDDLKRIYLSTKVVGGDTFLNLAWVRIPQNTTSASAHVAFEFNKGTAGTCTGSSLVNRVAGDMLVVYDFEGGTDMPAITLRRWVTSGACEVGSRTPPCWGPATDLTELGFAEAAVNVGQTVEDELTPPPPPPDEGPSVSEMLEDSEFGEAGINLTDAGVFDPGTCESFGTAFGVSRSSGNSGTAQMKDLVGPADFRLANCGTVITRKVTDPAGDTTTSFGYTTNVTTTPATTPSPFSLKDGESNTIENVNPGSDLNVTEDDPGPGYRLTNIDCSASSVPAANISTDTATRAVTFSIAGGETLDCTFTNTLQLGAIEISKVGKDKSQGSGDQPLSGAHFQICTNDGPYDEENPCIPAKTGSGDLVTGADGTVCVDDLTFGDYYVTETSPPSGYSKDDSSTHTVTVNNNATCDVDDPETTADDPESISFTDTPLTDIDVDAAAQAAGATESQINCVDAQNNDVGNSGSGFSDPAHADADDLPPGTYTCTVVIDP